MLFNIFDIIFKGNLYEFFLNSWKHEDHTFQGVISQQTNNFCIVYLILLWRMVLKIENILLQNNCYQSINYNDTKNIFIGNIVFWWVDHN